MRSSPACRAPRSSAYPIAGSDFAAFVQLARSQIAQPGEGDAFARGGEVQLGDGRWIRISRSATQDGGFFLLFSDFTDIKEREERYKEAKLQAEAASSAKHISFIRKIG